MELEREWKPNPRKPIARAADANATESWFDMAISKATPIMCFDHFAPPTARLCSALQ